MQVAEDRWHTNMHGNSYKCTYASFVWLYVHDIYCKYSCRRPATSERRRHSTTALNSLQCGLIAAIHSLQFCLFCACSVTCMLRPNASATSQLHDSNSCSGLLFTNHNVTLCIHAGRRSATAKEPAHARWSTSTGTVVLHIWQHSHPPILVFINPSAVRCSTARACILCAIPRCVVSPDVGVWLWHGD